MTPVDGLPFDQVLRSVRHVVARTITEIAELDVAPNQRGDRQVVAMMAAPRRARLPESNLLDDESRTGPGLRLVASPDASCAPHARPA